MTARKLMDLLTIQMDYFIKIGIETIMHPKDNLQ